MRNYDPKEIRSPNETTTLIYGGAEGVRHVVCNYGSAVHLLGDADNARQLAIYQTKDISRSCFSQALTKAMIAERREVARWAVMRTMAAILAIKMGFLT